MDVDSTVKGAGGHQEGAATGFNPHHKGQRSYHPLLAFSATTKEVLHSWWRGGKAYSGNGAAEFFAETCPRLPESKAGYVFRADSGFFSDSFLSAIEAAGHDYLVKLKNLKPLLARQSWQSIPGEPEIAYCELDHRCAGWDRPRRLVGIRTLQETLTEGWLFLQPVYRCNDPHGPVLGERPAVADGHPRL